MIWKRKWYHGRDCCDDSGSCEQLKKRVADKYFEKNLDFEAYHLQLQEIHVTITILEWLVSTWHIYLTKIPEEKNLKLSDLNQIYCLLATLSVPQHIGFFWIPAAKAPYYKSWLGTSDPDCHLMPKIGHFQKTEVGFKS